MRYIERERTDVYLFDSVSEVAREVLEAHQSKPADFRCHVASRHMLGRGGIRSLAEAVALVDRPWPDGLGAVESMLRTLMDSDMPRPVGRPRVRRWSEDDGDEFNLDRFRGGLPHWETRRRKRRVGPANITIVTDVTAHGRRRPDEVLWRGAAAVALSRFLEDAGYRVELWSIRHATGATETIGMRFGRDRGIYAAVRAKSPGEFLDLGAVIVSVSSWFYRSVLWCANDMRRDRKSYSGIGNPSNIDKHLDAVVRPDDHVIVIDGVWDECDALDLLRRELGKLVELSEAVART